MYKEVLNQYRDIDNKIIYCLENDGDNLLELFDQRDEIVKAIVELKEYKDEIKNQFISMKLNELDQKIKMLISSNMIDIKNKIKNSQKGQKAFNSYNAAQRVPNFYSRIL